MRGRDEVAVLEARELVKRYGEREALRGVELRGRGRGAGGGDRAQRGRARRRCSRSWPGFRSPTGARFMCQRGEVGWVPQQAALYRRLTVEENLLLFARLEKHQDPHASVEEMLELTGLGERRGEIVARLSGGNQQRINIAIGLLARPSVLLLDEPSVGLDPRQRARLWEFVVGAGRRAGDDGDLLHPRHPGGRALRQTAAGARRRRGALRRLGRGAARGGAARRRPRPRARTSRPPSSPSSTTGGTDALAAAQGPADPPPLPAAGVPAGRLPGPDRGPRRFRDLALAGEAAGRLPQRSAERRAGQRRHPASCRRSASATGSASGSSASTSRAAPKRPTRSAQATCWRR